MKHKTRLLQKLSKFPFCMWLLVKSVIYRLLSGDKLFGKEFDFYGRKISFKFLLSGDGRCFFYLFCNPVSIVRYFEFDFAYRSVDWSSMEKWLDVSSPRLLLMYILKKFTSIRLTAVNPDTGDLNETARYSQILDMTRRASFSSQNAKQLSYQDCSFDVVSCLSVIEHIPDLGDALVIKEMMRVLKPTGKLVLTFPCAKNYFEEWRDSDVYGLGATRKQNKYFFQRVYDPAAIKERLVDVIGSEPVKTAVFGEKVEGTYFAYEQRWLKKGIEETIKDPLYIAKQYRLYNSIDDMPGRGVCGMIFEKGIQNV
jgi:ubiquinone/menaquinone biosynthesis C-methylase UbiE